MELSNTNQHNSLSLEERYVRCTSVVKCVLCEATGQGTIIVWDTVKNEFSMPTHKITIDNGGHNIFLCHHHFEEVKDGVRK